MEEKIIKITLEQDDKILFYNNGNIKKTIDKNCNEISGQDILDILDANLNDSFKLEPIQVDSKSSRYKVYEMIYELFKGIIEKLVTNEKDFTFDVDVNEMNPYDIQEL